MAAEIENIILKHNKNDSNDIPIAGKKLSKVQLKNC